MCIGDVALLCAVREEEGVRVGVLEGGTEVPLAFVPEAQPGDDLLLHLGIPVQVLHDEDGGDT